MDFSTGMAIRPAALTPGPARHAACANAHTVYPIIATVYRIIVLACRGGHV